MEIKVTDGHFAGYSLSELPSGLLLHLAVSPHVELAEAAEQAWFAQNEDCVEIEKERAA